MFDYAWKFMTLLQFRLVYVADCHELSVSIVPVCVQPLKFDVIRVRHRCAHLWLRLHFFCQMFVPKFHSKLADEKNNFISRSHYQPYLHSITWMGVDANMMKYPAIDLCVLIANLAIIPYGKSKVVNISVNYSYYTRVRTSDNTSQFVCSELVFAMFVAAGNRSIFHASGPLCTKKTPFYWYYEAIIFDIICAMNHINNANAVLCGPRECRTTVNFIINSLVCRWNSTELAEYAIDVFQWHLLLVNDVNIHITWNHVKRCL